MTVFGQPQSEDFPIIVKYFAGITMSLSSRTKKLFGVALDPSDDPLSLELKRAWMDGAGKGGDRFSSYLDPYDAVIDNMTNVLNDRHIEPAGKFPVSSWLRPRPEPSDWPLVTAQNIGEFYDSGGFREILRQLQQFVQDKIFPAMPVMVGIDHSATMVVISALAEKHGPHNLSVFVLDQHFDAIPLSVRLAETSRVTSPAMRGLPFSPPPIPLRLKDHCCCGNFWAYLIDEGRILPQNLSFIGVADYPGRQPEAGKDSAFRKSYLSFEERGASFFPLQEFEKRYRRSLARFIRNKLTSPLAYISLDLDVGSYNSSFAARYMDRPGISRRNLLDTAGIIAGECRRGGVEIAGLDIMEFNMHFLGIETDDGVKDETLTLVKDFITALT
jgi:arginase family enzyme